jgi:hypothetical protein
MNTREDGGAVPLNKLLHILVQIIQEIMHKPFAISIHESNCTNTSLKFV